MLHKLIFSKKTWIYYGNKSFHIFRCCILSAPQEPYLQIFDPAMFVANKHSSLLLQEGQQHREKSLIGFVPGLTSSSACSPLPTFVYDVPCPLLVSAAAERSFPGFQTSRAQKFPRGCRCRSCRSFRGVF